MTAARGSIGFLIHPREGAGESLTEALDVAARSGFTTWVARHDPEALVAARAVDCRLLVTVGGDGTFLLGARLAGPLGVPLLGVNRGQLGFLTDLELDQLPAALAEFAAGNHREQRRTLLTAELAGPGREGAPALHELALNEVVVKTSGTNLARIRVEVDGELLGEFDADGVIVATATGSTAYALSAGGPPVDPRLRAVVVVPLAAHAVLSRPVVLPEAVELCITLVKGRAIAAADGHVAVEMREGMRLAIGPGPEIILVRVSGATSFLRSLREKLRIGLPLKQHAAVESPTPEDE